MKHIFKLIPSGLLAIILATGCDTQALHDLNINPNAVNEIEMNYFFTAAELGLASGGSRGDNRYIDWRTNIGMCAHAMQQLDTVSTGLLASVTNTSTMTLKYQTHLSSSGSRMLEEILLRYLNKPVLVVSRKAREKHAPGNKDNQGL